MSRRRVERYPLAPLLERAGCSQVELSRRLRMRTGRQVVRWHHEGIPETTDNGVWDADRVCLALGLLPHEVWADWYERCPVAS